MFNEEINSSIIKSLIKYLITVIFLITSIIFLYNVVTNFITYINEKENYSKHNHYNYLIISKDRERMIGEIDNYILNSKKNIEFIDSQAAIYKIPIDQYSKDYDMLLKGNIGENGEEKIIKQIQEKKNTEYFVLKNEYPMNWQVPIKIVDYVKDNKKKVGEILIFDIYE